MGRSVPEATIAIGRIRSMPFGRSRAEAAARQVRMIEAEGPEEVRAYALESLVEALTWIGESEKALVPFVKLLRWWDTHPEHFDTGDQNILFWEFGWVVNDLCRNPDVPVERVERTLDDMERRFSLASRGMERVWSCRLEWDLLRNGKDLEQTFTTWLTMPLDEEDSCPACHQEHHAEYLLETGDIPGAVAILEAAVAAELSCSREPASMLSMLAWCYLELGRLDDLDRVLSHAQAEMKAATSMSVLVASGRLFEVFARGGNPARAIAGMVKITEGMATATPYVRLETLRHLIAGTYSLVEQGYGDQLMGKVTVAEFAHEAEIEAEELTEAFDRRHGNGVQAERLARAKSARPAARPVGIIHVEAPAVVQNTVEVVEPATVLRSTTLDEAESAFQAQEHGLAADLYRLAAEESQNQGWLAQAGWCWAEAARNSQEISDVKRAAHDYVEAQVRLKAAGVTLEEIAPMFIAWAPAVREKDYSTFIHLALEDYPTPAWTKADLEEVISGEASPLAHLALLQASMIGSPLIRRYLLARAELRDAVARVMATWGDAADKQTALEMAEESATRFSTLGRTEAAAHSWWLAGKLAAALRDESADANFAMALQGFKSTGVRNRRFGVKAAGDYAVFLSSTGHKDKAAQILRTWKDE